MKHIVVKVHTDCFGLRASPLNELCCNGNLLDAEGCDCLTLDWSRVGFASITKMVALTQLGAAVQAHGGRVRVIPPSRSVDSYVSRMNFYRLLGLDMRESFRRHDPADRFIPARKIETADDPGWIATSVREMIMHCVEAPGNQVAGFVDISFSEIMDNVINHSLSPAKGVAAGQYYPNMGFVELCVADSGQGIATSMGTNPLYANQSPLERVLSALEERQGQYVGRPAFRDSETSGGMGLTLAMRTTTALGGQMWIVSRKEAIEVTEVGASAVRGLYYPGTVVSLRLPVSHSSTILESQIFPEGNDVPVSWSAAEGVYPLWDEGADDGILW